MQVYSVGDLCLGVFVGGVGAAMLVMNLLKLVKGEKFKTYKDMKWFATSLLYTVYGACSTSRAFDPPHQDSQRTDVIYCVSIPVFFITIGILYFALCRLPKNPTV